MRLPREADCPLTTEPGKGSTMNYLPTARHDGWTDHLLCPQCGHDCTHVDAVDVSTPTGTTRVWAKGEDERGRIVTETINRSEQGRRHTIGVLINCENGCNTVLSLQQHKGATFVRSTNTTPDIFDDKDYRPGSRPVALRDPAEA